MNRCPECGEMDSVIRGSDKVPDKCNKCGEEWPHEVKPKAVCQTKKEEVGFKNPVVSPPPESLLAKKLEDALSDV